MLYRKVCVVCVLAAFLTTTIMSPQALAKTPFMPVPGTLVGPSAIYEPVLMKGLVIDPNNPFEFEFLIDSGHSQLEQDNSSLKEASNRLIKYFLSALTIPEQNLWVNLSPYEKDRMLPVGLDQTTMGKDMLAQDYLLKQLTSSLIYPEKELGAKFWNSIYKEAAARYGTTDIPMDTFHKVWIVPKTADIYEHNQVAYITDAKLKVMLDEDYQQQVMKDPGSEPVAAKLSGVAESGMTNQVTGHRSLSTELMREIIIPVIEKEVNQGENFAQLRQMFHSMILASWYKLALKDSIMNQVYANKGKTSVGLGHASKEEKERIYQQYLENYKKGVFNYIKEEMDPITEELMPKKYFAGGNDFGMLAGIVSRSAAMPLGFQPASGVVYRAKGPVSPVMSRSDFAMQGEFREGDFVLGGDYNSIFGTFLRMQDQFVVVKRLDGNGEYPVLAAGARLVPEAEVVQAIQIIKSWEIIDREDDTVSFLYGKPLEELSNIEKFAYLVLQGIAERQGYNVAGFTTETQPNGVYVDSERAGKEAILTSITKSLDQELKELALTPENFAQHVVNSARARENPTTTVFFKAATAVGRGFLTDIKGFKPIVELGPAGNTIRPEIIDHNTDLIISVASNVVARDGIEFLDTHLETCACPAILVSENPVKYDHPNVIIVDSIERAIELNNQAHDLMQSFAAGDAAMETEEEPPLSKNNFVERAIASLKKGEHPTILFVEDNSTQASWWQSKFRSAQTNGTVIWASSRGRALEAWSNHKGDIGLVIVDRGLPDIHGGASVEANRLGVDVVNTIIADGADVPIILTSANPDPADTRDQPQAISVPKQGLSALMQPVLDFLKPGDAAMETEVPATLPDGVNIGDIVISMKSDQPTAGKLLSYDSGRVKIRATTLFEPQADVGDIRIPTNEELVGALQLAQELRPRRLEDRYLMYFRAGGRQLDLLQALAISLIYEAAEELSLQPAASADGFGVDFGPATGRSSTVEEATIRNWLADKERELRSPGAPDRALMTMPATTDQAKLRKIERMLRDLGYNEMVTGGVWRYLQGDWDFLQIRQQVQSELSEEHPAQWILDAAWLTVVHDLNEQQFIALRNHLNQISTLGHDLGSANIGAIIRDANLLHIRWRLVEQDLGHSAQYSLVNLQLSPFPSNPDGVISDSMLMQVFQSTERDEVRNFLNDPSLRTGNGIIEDHDQKIELEVFLLHGSIIRFERIGDISPNIFFGSWLTMRHNLRREDLGRWSNSDGIFNQSISSNGTFSEEITLRNRSNIPLSLSESNSIIFDGIILRTIWPLLQEQDRLLHEEQVGLEDERVNQIRYKMLMLGRLLGRYGQDVAVPEVLSSDLPIGFKAGDLVRNGGLYGFFTGERSEHGWSIQLHNGEVVGVNVENIQRVPNHEVMQAVEFIEGQGPEMGGDSNLDLILFVAPLRRAEQTSIAQQIAPYLVQAMAQDLELDLAVNPDAPLGGTFGFRLQEAKELSTISAWIEKWLQDKRAELGPLTRDNFAPRTIAQFEQSERPTILLVDDDNSNAEFWRNQLTAGAQRGFNLVRVPHLDYALGFWHERGIEVDLMLVAEAIPENEEQTTIVADQLGLRFVEQVLADGADFPIIVMSAEVSDADAPQLGVIAVSHDDLPEVMQPVVEFLRTPEGDPDFAMTADAFRKAYPFAQEGTLVLSQRFWGTVGVIVRIDDTEGVVVRPYQGGEERTHPFDMIRPFSNEDLSQAIDMIQSWETQDENGDTIYSYGSLQSPSSIHTFAESFLLGVASRLGFHGGGRGSDTDLTGVFISRQWLSHERMQSVIQSELERIRRSLASSETIVELHPGVHSGALVTAEVGGVTIVGTFLDEDGGSATVQMVTGIVQSGVALDGIRPVSEGEIFEAIQLIRSWRTDTPHIGNPIYYYGKEFSDMSGIEIIAAVLLNATAREVGYSPEGFPPEAKIAVDKTTGSVILSADSILSTTKIRDISVALSRKEQALALTKDNVVDRMVGRVRAKSGQPVMLTEPQQQFSGDVFPQSAQPLYFDAQSTALAAVTGDTPFLIANVHARTFPEGAVRTNIGANFIISAQKICGACPAIIVNESQAVAQTGLNTIIVHSYDEAERLIGQVKQAVDVAIRTEAPKAVAPAGGIDFDSSNLNMNITGQDQAMQINIDPAMLNQIQSPNFIGFDFTIRLFEPAAIYPLLGMKKPIKDIANL